MWTAYKSLHPKKGNKYEISYRRSRKRLRPITL